MLRSRCVFTPSYVPQVGFPPRAQVYKQPFTQEEDQVILDFVRANGAKNWNCVASELDGRTPKQCRERWHNHLDPSIHKGPWSAEEDLILAEKQAVLGNKWAGIARFLPGRTDTLVKNRWNTSVRQRVAVDIAGHITVLPAVAHGLFDLGSPPAQSPAEPPAERGSVVAWLDDFKGKGGALVQSLWNEWMPPLLKRKD
jgi:hypothetical protein